MSAYYAEHSIDTRASGSYDNFLTFKEDGRIEHYTVDLDNNAVPGKIWVKYNGNTHHLITTARNIKKLTIDCRSIAEEWSRDITGLNYESDENFYKEYFISKDKFTITVNVDHSMDLALTDIPYPSRVIVDDQTLLEGRDFTISKGRISTKVPKGDSQVTIHFTATGDEELIASFKTDNKDFYHLPNKDINFDASESSGDIKDYIWDFGDGTFGSGVKIKHRYNLEDNYKVTLVVRDENGFIQRDTKTLFVYDKDEDGLPDNWELKYNAIVPESDGDIDGLINLDEYFYNTNPNEYDTDSDGFSDGDEIDAGTDPLDSESTPVIDEKQQEGVGIWMFFAVFGAVIVVIMLIFAYAGYIHYVREKDQVVKKRSLKAKGKGLPTRVPSKKERSIVSISDRPIGYAASTIPKEVLTPDKRHPSPPLRPPFKPPSTKPRLKDLRHGLDDRHGLSHGLMVDDELKVPTGAKIVYECPTCESPIKKDDEICQVCGEQFDD